MDRSKDRGGMLAGVVFAILFAVGALLISSASPNTSKGDSATVAHAWLIRINNSGHRASIVIGGILLVIAAIALIWFSAALRSRFAISPANPAGGFAILAAVGIAVGSVGPLAIAGGHTFGNEPLPTDGTVIWMFNDLLFPCVLLIFGLASSAFIAALLLTARSALPTWLVIFGWVAVVAGIVGVLFIPLALVLLWYICLGVYGATRAAPAEEPAVT
jgi:hypothetical protein